MLRLVALLGGLAGAAGMSQFPEYSQQYTQRLAGAVDELRVVVEDFDASAQASGLTREEALAELSGSEFLDRRQADMTRVINRYTRLQSNLITFENAGPFARLRLTPRVADPEIAAKAWDDFKPAVPLTPAGAVFAGIGYVSGWLGLAMLWSLIRLPFRRRRRVN